MVDAQRWTLEDWLGDALAADGITWLREAEFAATRVG
jgi:hypothetical protein